MTAFERATSPCKGQRSKLKKKMLQIIFFLLPIEHHNGSM